MDLNQKEVENWTIFPGSKVITADSIDLIDFSGLIYCEFTPAGSMGNSGGVFLYQLKDEDSLITYETNLNRDEKAFFAISDLIAQSSQLFVRYYGGIGNYAYVKKDTSLEIDELEMRFWFQGRKSRLKIESSTPGVFLGVAYEMKTKNTN